MLLDGVNHIAWISKDVERLGRFYETVFDAVVGPTREHGPGETMTTIDIGPVTQLNIFVISGNIQAERQTPMWGRVASITSVLPRRRRTRSKPFGPDSSKRMPAMARSTTSAPISACSSAIRTVWKVRFCYESDERELLASSER